ncbi:MAG: TRAP transporter substrate-binding protein DctP [Paracoccaceae bacterium]
MSILRPLAALILATAVLAVQPATAKTIKIATVAPEDSPWFEVLQKMAREWETASGGAIETRIYAGGIAGDEFDLVRKMRVGQLDVAMLSIGSLPDIAWQLSALHMPLMIESNEELDYVMAGVGPTFDALLREQGFRVLAWGDAGWVHFFTTKPVVTPEDLRPLRLFQWGSNSPYLDAWKDFGFNPVPVPTQEIHTALTTGMIEAIVVPPIAALSFQWFGTANHMTAMPWAPMVGAIVISERSWRKIPKAHRVRFLAIAAAASAEAKERTRAVEPQAIEAMQAHGLTIHPVPPEALAEWRTAVEKGFSPLIGSAVPADLLARVRQLVAEYRAGVAAQ